MSSMDSSENDHTDTRNVDDTGQDDGNAEEKAAAVVPQSKESGSKVEIDSKKEKKLYPLFIHCGKRSKQTMDTDTQSDTGNKIAKKRKIQQEQIYMKAQGDKKRKQNDDEDNENVEVHSDSSGDGDKKRKQNDDEDNKNVEVHSDSSGDGDKKRKQNDDEDNENVEVHSDSSGDEESTGHTYRFSTYKLRDSFVTGGYKTEEDLHATIKSLLEGMVGIKMLIKKRHRYKDWSMSWFVYETDQEINKNSVRIKNDARKTKRQESKDEDLTNQYKQIPGPRRTTNIVVFYHVLNGQPQVFFLFDSIQPKRFLYYADPRFPVNVANQFMDSTKIKQIETFNISGASLETSKTFLPSDCDSPFDGPNWCRLNEVVKRATSSIDMSYPGLSSLDMKLNENESVDMTIGQYFARVEKDLTLDQHSKFLSLVTKMDKDETRTPFYSFGYVHKVDKGTEKDQISECEKFLKMKAIKYFLGKNQENNNLSFYHPCVFDWVTTNSVIFHNAGKIDQTDQSMKRIREWNFNPGLSDIRKALKSKYEEGLEDALNSDDFKLSFQMRNKRREIHNLLLYIHGNIVDSNGVTFHKIANKWYRITGEYSDIVDKTFLEFMRNCCPKGNEHQSTKLPLPWRKCSTFSRKELVEYFGLGIDDVETLLQILCNQTEFVKQSDAMCDLPAWGCSFPVNCEIFRKINWEKCKTMKINGKKHDSKVTFVHAVEESLYKNVLSHSPCDLNSMSEELRNVLLLPRKVVRQTKDKNFTVVNPNLTNAIITQISQRLNHAKSLTITELVTFLRSRTLLNEGEYNETYLLQEDFIPGDRVKVNNNVVELFDIMRHDKEKNTTYLYHVKEGFNYLTRIACSQIRVAAKLFWMDRLTGKSVYPDLFYKHSTSSESANSVYRKLLETKMKKYTEEEFRKMFSPETKLVFVYAFRDSKDISSLCNVGPVCSSEFQDITNTYHLEKDVIMDTLKKFYLTEAGFLRDSFIDVNTNDFQRKVKDHLPGMESEDLKKLFDILAQHRCCISTIPKLELLELDRDFAQYQIGGKKVFELKLLNIA